MNRNTVEIEKYPEGDPVKNRNNKKNPWSWFDLGDKAVSYTHLTLPTILVV